MEDQSPLSLGEMIKEQEEHENEFKRRVLSGEAKWGAWRFNPKNMTLEIGPEVHGGAKDFPYSVDVKRCNNSDQVLDWLLQLNDKSWCPKEQIGYLLQAINDLIDLHREADRKLLKVEEVARILRVSKLSVYRMIKNGKLKEIRLPLGRKGEIRISQDELNRFIGDSSPDREA